MFPALVFQVFFILGYGTRCLAQDSPPGQWGSWSEWGQCSSSCSEGIKTRTRECGGGSKRCLGVRLDTGTCDAGPCPSWEAWGPWGKCATTCGQGSRERTRKCSGEGCPGSHRGFGECASTCPCPRNQRGSIFQQNADRTGEWKPWGDWSSCSVSCGTGIRKSCRECAVLGSCEGPISRAEVCDEGPCVQSGPNSGQWENWESWAPCDATCGEGITLRSRKCSDDKAQCLGKITETKSCSSISCQGIVKDEVWTPWSLWTECTQSCGSGLTERKRTCKAPSKSACGTAKDYDFKPCNENPCSGEAESPISSSWGPWSPCSHTCGNGTLVRRKKCDPKKSNDCVSRPVETKACFLKECAQKSSEDLTSAENLVIWTSWEACSVTCGVGTRQRQQVCFGDCTKARKQQKKCELGSCSAKSSDKAYEPWSQWSECTVTCGDGLSKRTRSCRKQSSGCNEDQTESRGCSHWKSCSKSTSLDLIDFPDSDSNDAESESESTYYEGSGGGKGDEDLSQLLTSLRNPKKPIGDVVFGQNGDLAASKARKSSDEIKAIDEIAAFLEAQKTDAPKPSESKWLQWSSWTACSKTCGNGTTSRHRKCSNNSGCKGENLQGVGCSISSCNESGPINWGEWSSWQPCSVTCGYGTRKRFRDCQNKGHSFCAGKFRQTEECVEESCELIDSLTATAWGPWSEWSACSKTCGGGTSKRTRSCKTGDNCKGTANQSKFCSWDDCDVKTAKEKKVELVAAPRSQKVELVEIPTKISSSPNRRPLVDGPSWNEWGRWTSCSRTCGHGERSRIRQCEDESGRFSSLCEGKPFEKTLCRVKDCEPGDEARKPEAQTPNPLQSAALNPIHPSLIQQLLRNAVQLQSLGGNQVAQQQLITQIQQVIQSLAPAQQTAGAQQIQRSLLSLQQSQQVAQIRGDPRLVAQTQAQALILQGLQQAVQQSLASLILQGVQGNPQGQQQLAAQLIQELQRNPQGQQQLAAQLIQELQRNLNPNSNPNIDPNINPNVNPNIIPNSSPQSQTRPQATASRVVPTRVDPQQNQQSAVTDQPPTRRQVDPRTLPRRSREFERPINLPREPFEPEPHQLRPFIRASSLTGRQPLSSSIPQTSGRSGFPTRPDPFSRSRGDFDLSGGPSQPGLPEFPTPEEGDFGEFFPPDEGLIGTGPVPLPPELDRRGSVGDRGSVSAFSWEQWNDWLPCSKTCSGGLAVRIRYCEGGDSTRCEGSAVDRRACNSEIPCPGEDQRRTEVRTPVTREAVRPPGWSSWAPWGQCSVSCGQGVTLRRRNCLPGAPCDLHDRQSKDCDAGPCNGERFRSRSSGWGLWSSWTDCTVSCGGGFTFRQRDCLAQREDACAGGTKQRKPCNTEQCPTRNSFNRRERWQRVEQTSFPRQVESQRIRPATFPPPSPPERPPIRPLPPQPFENFEQFGALPPQQPSRSANREPERTRQIRPLPPQPFENFDQFGALQPPQPPRASNRPAPKVEPEEDIFYPDRQLRQRQLVRPPGFSEPDRWRVTSAPIVSRKSAIPTRRPLGTECQWTPWGAWSQCEGLCPGSRSRLKLCVCAPGEPKSVCEPKRVKTISVCPRGECREPAAIRPRETARGRRRGSRG